MDELWVDVDGARVFVRGWGERRGRPLLCWHGVGLTSRASLFLNEAAPLLADGYGCESSRSMHRASASRLRSSASVISRRRWST